MAYKIVSQAKAWWPIRFNGVTEEGEIVVNEIRGRFVILDEDEFVAFNDDVAKVGSELVQADNPDDRKTLSGVLSPFILRILENWEGVIEDDGSEGGRSVPFTKDNLERMLRVPNFAGGVTEAYRDLRKAQPEQRKGN
ncbi:hypothetical protein [Sphingopyxis sp. FD7]|uniref:hypothetical protein n=1 Tax=Sphingopyxis sp. FD7 TaxID=1914525 RepID=UPI000DC6382B|nr:hypothetical protein [Sphingopyxis sp. FD7]BBB13423.1 hypothetical protein SPYCA_2681 [Sphingopyxis sp. FD7]